MMITFIIMTIDIEMDIADIEQDQCNTSFHNETTYKPIIHNETVIQMQSPNDDCGIIWNVIFLCCGCIGCPICWLFSCFFTCSPNSTVRKIAWLNICLFFFATIIIICFLLLIFLSIISID